MEKHSSRASAGSKTHLLSDFERLSYARANIWLTTLTVLAITLLIILLVASPYLPLLGASASNKPIAGTATRGTVSMYTPPAGDPNPSLDFRTDIQTPNVPEWTSSVCPSDRSAQAPKGARPQTSPKVVVQLEGDANNLVVGQAVKFKVFYYDCGWQLGNTFANWRDNSVYLDGFTMTPSPLGAGEIAVPENYYEQTGPYLRPGAGSWWSVNHVFSKPGTYPIRFRIRNGGAPGASTVVTFPVKIKGSGQQIVCDDTATVKLSMDSSSPQTPHVGWDGAGSALQPWSEVAKIKVEGTSGSASVNSVYVAVEGKDGAFAGMDQANFEPGVFTEIGIFGSSGEMLGEAGSPTATIEQDMDKRFRNGIVNWGGAGPVGGASKQVWLYPVRLKTPLVLQQGQSSVVSVKVVRTRLQLQQDGWRFGIARAECGFGLNMTGGSTYSNTPFSAYSSTAGFQKVCSYRPPHPVSVTGGCYEWQDQPTCAWKVTDCSNVGANGSGAIIGGNSNSKVR